MELASIFSQNTPPIGIDLVFFDAEDVGINGKPYTFAMGSEYFSKNLPIEKPKSAIIIDMIGDKYLKIPIERFSYRINPEMVKEIWSLANVRDGAGANGMVVEERERSLTFRGLMNYFSV